MELPDYQIVTASAASDLVKHIQAYMADGYKPQGGISYIKNYWHQAVFKDEAVTPVTTITIPSRLDPDDLSFILGRDKNQTGTNNEK